MSYKTIQIVLKDNFYGIRLFGAVSRSSKHDLPVRLFRVDSMSVHARIPRGKIFRPVMFPKKEQAQAGLVARLGLGFVCVE